MVSPRRRRFRHGTGTAAKLGQDLIYGDGDVGVNEDLQVGVKVRVRTI